MREGSVFRYCTRCKKRVTARDRRCPGCGHERFAWGFVVDLAPPGAPRDQRKKVGFPTKTDALDYMHRAQAEKAAGTYVEPSKLTVAAYLERWLDGGCGGHVRPSTLTSYEGAVRLHIVPRIGSVLLQQLDKPTIKALYQMLSTGGYTSRVKPKEPRAAPQPAPRGLSPKTVHNVHLALRKALADAVEDGLIRSNPAAGAHKLGRDAAPEMLTWSKEELRRFLDAVQNDRDYGLWRLAAQTGMRRGELLGLRWRDVDLDGARLSVRQQLVRAGTEVAQGPPKTAAGRRLIALDVGTVAALCAHRALVEEERARCGPAYHDHDLVFCRPDGHPEDPDVVSERFQAAIGGARAPRIRLHDLRHTHATLLLKARVHPKIVQERLGHASITITLDRYSHVIEGLQAEAATKIGELVDGRVRKRSTRQPGGGARRRRRGSVTDDRG
jgi:integrase